MLFRERPEERLAGGLVLRVGEPGGRQERGVLLQFGRVVRARTVHGRARHQHDALNGRARAGAQHVLRSADVGPPALRAVAELPQHECQMNNRLGACERLVERSGYILLEVGVTFVLYRRVAHVDTRDALDVPRFEQAPHEARSDVAGGARDHDGTRPAQPAPRVIAAASSVKSKPSSPSPATSNPMPTLCGPGATAPAR